MKGGVYVSANRSNLIILGLGLGILTLGLLKLFNIISIDNAYMVSIAVTAFAFTFADFLDLFNEPKNKFLKRVLSSDTWNSFGILSFVIYPHIPMTDSNIVDNLNVFLTLASLGLVLVLIGLKSHFSNKKTFEQYNEYYNIVKEYPNNMKEYKEAYEAKISELEKNIELLKERIDIYDEFFRKTDNALKKNNHKNL